MTHDYDEVAELLEKLAAGHQQVAEMLRSHTDPANAEGNTDLADAEDRHADACRRAAFALRTR